jgi:6-phosphogluconolactonase (cycloisomerase 2 family)
MLRMAVRKSVSLLAIVVLQIAVSSCGDGSGASRTQGTTGNGQVSPAAFLYAASTAINVFSVNTDNSFGLITGSAINIPSGTPTLSVAVVNNAFLYVLDFVGSISAYSINRPSGTLSQLSGTFPTFPAGAVFGIDPLNRFMFVVTNTSVITVNINATSGALSLNSVSVPLPIPFTAKMTAGVDPQGRFLFISSGTAGMISFAIASGNGALTLSPGAPFPTPITKFVIDPQTKFLYGVDGVSNNIYGLQIALNGTLTNLTGFPIQTTGIDLSVAMHPGGGFLYIGQSNDIGGFTRNPTTGALTGIVQNASFTNTLSADQLVFDPHRQFLFASGRLISVLAVNQTTGTVTLNANQVNGTPFFGSLLAAAD